MIEQLELFKTEKKGHHKADTYTGIYAMHKYWSKKPYNIIRTFIEKYSKKNEIILDPFCGSGISVIESIILGRKVIGIDINPSAIFITEEMIKKINTNEVLKYFENIKEKVKLKIDKLYEIKREGNTIYATHFIWENGKLSEIWYSNGGREKKVFKPLAEDELKAKAIKVEDIPYFYPTTSFFHNPRVNTKKGQKVSDLFTPRNLYALSMLYNEVEKIESVEIKNLLKFVFTSSVGQSSKMVFIVKHRGKNNGSTTERKEVGSWVIGYWTPKDFFEINVWKNFESRFNKIVKAKNKQLFAHYEIKETSNIQDIIYKDFNLCLLNQPAQKILEVIPDNSIDYIITDPPHGDRIPYLELGTLWNSWLKKEANFNDEIVVSNAKERKKDIKDYNLLINKVFDEIYRVLKPYKYFSLMFNSLDDTTWINLMSHLTKIGFELSNIETLGYSANSVVQDNRKKGLKTDFVLTFKKSTKSLNEFKIIALKENKSYLENSVTEIINKENNKETYNIINQIFKYFLNKGQFFRLSEVIKIINEKVI
jgi:DNA modification methylase